MHIAHIVTRLLRAGSEENTLATCQWQIGAGHRVTLIHGATHDPYWEDNLPAGIERVAVPQMVHRVHPFRDILTVRRLRALLRDIAPDVIHTHQSKAGVLGRIAAAAVPGAMVVHGIHILPFQGVSVPKRALYIAAEKYAAQRTHLFIGVSEMMGRSFVQAGIAGQGQVHCVRSGMDLARFQNATPPTDWQHLLGLSCGQPRPKVVLMMAAFEPRKRHIPFLQALAKVAHTLPDFKLLLAGRGPEEARVRAAVHSLNLTGRVVFCGHRPDPEALFALADLSILTSEREGLPRVVVQSIASGCPVLVQDLPGLDELVTHHRNGWIADPLDMDATVGHMRALLTNDPQLAALQRGARATDLNDWALETLGARTTALYGLPMMRGRAAA